MSLHPDVISRLLHFLEMEANNLERSAIEIVCCALCVGRGAKMLVGRGTWQRYRMSSITQLYSKGTAGDSVDG